MIAMGSLLSSLSTAETPEAMGEALQQVSVSPKVTVSRRKRKVVVEFTPMMMKRRKVEGDEGEGRRMREIRKMMMGEERGGGESQQLVENRPVPRSAPLPAKVHLEPRKQQRVLTTIPASAMESTPSKPPTQHQRPSEEEVEEGRP